MAAAAGKKGTTSELSTMVAPDLGRRDVDWETVHRTKRSMDEADL